MSSWPEVRIMSEANDGTGAGLLAFLDWAGSRGEIAPATAQSSAVSVRKVLAVEADPDTVDVRAIHPVDLFGRFEVLHRTDYSSQSMKSYRSRFLNAVAMYLAWLDKQPDWKTAGGWNRRPGSALVRVSQGNGKPAAKAKSARSKPSARSAPPPSDPDPATETIPAAAAPMVPYDLPLRPGLRVRLVLPEVLTRADASRIAAFVSSLAFDQADVETEGG
jgi:hypothetical protein